MLAWLDNKANVGYLRVKAFVEDCALQCNNQDFVTVLNEF